MIYNRVLPLLVAASVAAVAGSGFVAVAPNRLLSGKPIGLFAAAESWLSLAIVALGAALLATALVKPSQVLYRTASLLAAALLLLVMATAGGAAASLAAIAPALARVSLGAAFWVVFAAAALAIIDSLQRGGAGTGERLATLAVLIAGFAIMAHAGVFDALSLAREYRTRETLFTAALMRHIELVAGSVIPAVLLGFPLGVATTHRPHWHGPVFAMLNLLQTIPSIALFGLLIVPLSALAAAAPFLAGLGVAGIGPAPAIIALVLYALLPIVRNTVAGIAGVDPAIIDAARGMGMTRRQLFRQVQLPLASPLLLAGLRVVTVQTIGLAVVAALIGAGGLGTFVFAGLGQYAADLVLLGALPTIALALIADFVLQRATQAARQ